MDVRVAGLRKEYEGGVVGLHGVDLDINDGIFALLGPNGAGKSTLMSILATLLDPTRGTATVGGFDVRTQKEEVRSILGYLPQDFGLYPSLTVFETLDYIGLLYNMRDPAERRRRIDEVISQVNLTAEASKPVGQLSGGMKQRVGLAQALINSPKLIIVDEPTAGLDPEERIRVRSLLAELGGERVILLSTHLIEDVAAVADRIAVLYKGRIRFVGTGDEMRDAVRGKVWEAEMEPTALREARKGWVETGLQRIGSKALLRVVAENCDLPHARSAEPTLDDAYIWLMRGDQDDA